MELVAPQHYARMQKSGTDKAVNGKVLDRALAFSLVRPVSTKLRAVRNETRQTIPRVPLSRKTASFQFLSAARETPMVRVVGQFRVLVAQTRLQG